MNEAEQEWTDWVSKLVAGDESTAADFWNQYGPRLRRLAGKHLAVGMERRVDADDVVQSACRSFLCRVQDDEFVLADSESLWRLMCVITMTKLRGKIRFHTRQKRGIDRERHFESSAGEGFIAGKRIESDEPSPEEAVAFAEQFERLLSVMDEAEQTVVELKLEQYTHQQIAERLGCSERTVRRIVKRIQAKLSRMLEDSIF